MNYEPPDYARLYMIEKDAKEQWIERAKRNEEELRDQFAMAALTGLTANPVHASMDEFDVFARTAYLSADAMLKAREVISE